MSVLLISVSAAETDLSVPQVVLNEFDTCFVQYGQVACWGRSVFGALGEAMTSRLAMKQATSLCTRYLGTDFIVEQVAGGSQYHHCMCFASMNRIL